MTQRKNMPTELVKIQDVYQGYLLLSKEDVATLNTIFGKNIHLMSSFYFDKDIKYKEEKNGDFQFTLAKTVASHEDMLEILNIMKYFGMSYEEAELAVTSQEIEKYKSKYPHLVKGEDNELSTD